MEEYDVLIVGGGPSSRILNKYLHFLDKDIKTAVLRDEERLINHCGTPYIVEGTIPWEKGLISEELVTKFGTPIIVDPLVGGDTDSKVVECESGRRIKYGKLVLATGTDQVLPPIPGIELEGVLKVRKTKDVTASMEYIGKVKKVAVLGAGYIGLEFAMAFLHMGKDVSVVEIKPHVMGGRTDDAMAETIEDHLRSLGIRLFLGRKVERIAGNSRVEAVELDGGEKLETEALLAAVGVKPLVDYAESLGLETSRDGIIVDEYFRTNKKDVYAIGDCIRTFSIVTKKPVPGKLGSNAGQMARCLGLNLSGFDLPYPGVLNIAVSRFGDISYGSVGLTEADAREQGLEVVTTRNSNTDIYDNMPEKKPVDAKLIFRKEDMVLVGGEMIHPGNPAGFLEALGQLVERKAGFLDVVTMSYSSHPELTPKTSKPYFVWAAEPLLKKGLPTGP